MEIVEVDPYDDGALAAWLEVMNIVDELERGDYSTTWSLPELIAGARHASKNQKAIRLLGRVDGQAVAAGQVRVPLLDNLTAADIEVSVLPAHRRVGLGSQLLVECERIAQEHGRTRFDTLTAWPYDGAPDGAGTSGVEFAQAHGYVFGLGNVQREVVLPIDDAILDRLAAQAAERSGGYELRSWTGPFRDDDLLLSYLELSSTLMTEAPMGDNDYEAEAVDIEAYRLHEQLVQSQRRTIFTTVAIDSEGRVAAYTDLVAPSQGARCVYQWGTLAGRAHRGHRLGLAVKIANLRALQATGLYDGRRLVTWNAEVNDHMIGINERFGFVAAARSGELQKKA